MIGVGADTFRAQVEQVIGELGPPETQTKRVLMFCTSGIRCSKLAVVLEDLGYRNMAMLDGGAGRRLCVFVL